MALYIDLEVSDSLSKNTTLPTAEMIQHDIHCLLNYLDDRSPYNIAIRITDDAEIMTLNHSFRQQAKPTNILSFPAELTALEKQLHGDDMLFLGDLILSQETIEREAQQQNKDILQHYTHLLIHGVLHLLGYDHIEDTDANEMEAIEVAVLAQLNIKNPYL